MLPNPDDERDRIDAARAGDAAAQAWLVDTYTPVVFRFAWRLMGDEQDARDATQDTLVKVLRALDRYDPRWRFVTWVLGVARNTCIDEFRRRKRWTDLDSAPEPASTAPGPAALAHERAESARVRAALATIPPLYREVLVLYHYEHLKYQEIAELLEIPIGTVMNRIFRARARLRAAWEAMGGEDTTLLDSAAEAR